MHLYVRAGDLYTEIPNITLKYGCIPTIGDYSEEEEGMQRVRESLNMEPAMWFKVLLLDSLSIDSIKRTVMWNCDSALSPIFEKSFEDTITKKQRRKRITESMYVGGEFYGFDSELDELFASVERTMYEYGRSEISQHEFYDKLLKLLHCHVLPAIPITVDDISRVEKVHQDIGDSIKKAEKVILKADKKMNEIFKSMQKLRQLFVQEYVQNSDKLMGPCYVSFARTLQQDVEEELQQSREKLEKLQDTVEKAKKKFQEKDSDMTEEIIVEKRRARDLCFEKHKDLLTTRETLHDITKQAATIDQKNSLTASIQNLRSKKNNAKQMLNLLHSIYVGLHNTLETARVEYQFQCEKKLLIISVKEAARTTMVDLQAGEATVGIDMDKLGHRRATDVLERSAVSREWQTIAEKVATILTDKSNKITQKHESFCQTVINRCKGVLFDKKLMEINDVKTKSAPHAKLLNRETSNSLPTELIDDIKVEDCRLTSDTGYQSDLDSDNNSERTSAITQPRGVSQVSQVSEAYSDSFVVQNCVLPTPGNIQDSIVQFEGVLDDQEIVLVQDGGKNLLKSAIDSLKSDILNHLQETTEMLQVEFDQHTPTEYKNIWLRYEAHFYERTMPHVVKLYELSYLQFAEWFSQSVSQLTASDLDLNGTVISRMLQDATPAKRSPESMVEVFNSSQGLSQRSRSPSLLESVCEELHLSDEPSLRDSFNYSIQLSEDENENYDTVLRRYKSERGPNNQKSRTRQSVDLKRITIDYPESITFLYNRRKFYVNGVGIEASKTMSPSSTTKTLGSRNMCTSAKLTKLLPDYQKVFQPALHCIHDAILIDTPLIKLQHLTKCLREINQGVSDFQSEHFNNSMEARADDLVDMLVIILCNCDMNDTMQLYSHLKLLTDLIPPFFEGGPYCFSLIQFSVAYQFIQERLVKCTSSSQRKY